MANGPIRVGICSPNADSLTLSRPVTSSSAIGARREAATFRLQAIPTGHRNWGWDGWGAQCVPAATTCHTLVIGPVRLLQLYASRRYGEAKFWHGSRHWLSERDRGGSGFVPVPLRVAARAALSLLYGR